MIIPDDTLAQSPPLPNEVDCQQPNPSATHFEDPSELPKTQTLDPQIHPGNCTNPSDVLENPTINRIKSASSRRGGNKRKRLSRKQLQVLQHKVEILKGKLKLIPFVPKKNLDFVQHESLLRRIGLWDFVHLELDRTDLCVDLISQLVANYKRQGRVSEVNGVRIKVSRADLGRALKLPAVTKDNNNLMAIGDEDEDFVNEKSVQFIEELMTNWMLLHDDDDAWILPEQVMSWIDMIRKGRLDKVEWASLMWLMVEKEISQGESLVVCFYASHLQHLIKYQNVCFFPAEPNGNVIMVEGEDGADVTMGDESHQHVTCVVSNDYDGEKMTLAASKKCEAEMVNTKEEEGGKVAMVDYGPENAALTVSKDWDDKKMALTASERHENGKVMIRISKSYTEEKIGKELVSFEAASENNDSYMMESVSHIEAVKNICESYPEEKIAEELVGFEAVSENNDTHMMESGSHIEVGKVIVCVGESYAEETINEEVVGDEAASANNDNNMMESVGHVEAGKVVICVGKSYAEEKIGEGTEELVGVIAASPNNNTHTMESVSHTETGKSTELIDLHNDYVEVKSEEPSVELTLGQDNTTKVDRAHADDFIDLDGLGFGDSDPWQLKESNVEAEPLLRQCSFGRDQISFGQEGREKDIITGEDVDDDNDNDNEDGYYGYADEEDEEDEKEDEAGGGGMDLSPRFDTLQGISDSHMFQGLDISQCAFGSPLSHINEAPIQHFTSHAETSSSQFGSTPKIAGAHDQNVSCHTVTDGNKRLKREGTWGHQEPSDFYRCMENIEQWIGKAKLIYASKEQECTQMGMSQQLLYDELRRREHMIEQQQKIAHEVRQKSQMEIYKLERELITIGELLDSYRNALKETRREFSEYRRKCSFPEEALYNDVGPGGVVLSVAELERQRFKQEEEDKRKCLELERQIKKFETEWYSVFEGHRIGVQKLDEKLLLFEEKAKLLKVLPWNQKAEEVKEHPVTKED